MNRFFALLITVFFASNFAFAQEKSVTIKGQIVERGTKLPIIFASVELFHEKDSSLVTGTVSDDNGFYEIEKVAPGNYRIVFSYISFKERSKKIKVTSDSAVVDLGVISLKEDVEMLSEAVVIAEVAPVIVKEDTTVFNTSSFNVSEGAMLEDLVKKLPGAAISEDGKLTINGKEITKIMVDGKEFFTDDPKIALKNLPANIIEKAKAYDRKSESSRQTGIDDDDDETVLDLSVKKGMKKGWVGNVFGGLGNKERYDFGGIMNRFDDDMYISVIASANNTNNTGFSELGDANVRLGNAGSGITTSRMVGATFAKEYSNLELGGNVQYGYSDNKAERESASETFLSDGSSYGRDTTRSRHKRDNLGVNFRLKWKPDTMTTVTFRPNFSYAQNDSESDGVSLTLNNNLDNVNRKSSSSLSEGENYSVGGRLQFIRKMKKKGRSLSLSANLTYSNSESDLYSNSRTAFYFYDEDDEFESDSISMLNRYTDRGNSSLNYNLQASYTEPVFRNHYLRLRYVFQQRKSTSESFIYNNDDQSLIDSLSSDVDNRYNTHQIEVGLQGQYPKMNYNIGLNVSPQESKSESFIGTNKNLDQSVVNYSPNLRFRYKFSKQHSLMFRYRGQSSAPDVEYLQTVIDQSDPLDVKYGNPDLLPSYKNNVMLRYNNYISSSQRSYIANASFANTINAITNRVYYNPETGAKETHKVNIDGNWNTSALFTFTTPLKNRKYSISSTTSGAFANSVGYTSLKRGADAAESETKDLMLSEKLSGIYRGESFDITLNASVDYEKTKNNLQTKNNSETFAYLLGGNTNITLPWSINFSTDANYKIYSGFADGFKENEVIWNAQLSKDFLRNNAATIRLKIYDILQQQSNLRRTATESMITDTRYNTLGSYFMVYFVYRINTVGKGAMSDDDDDDKFKRGGFGPQSGFGPMGGGFGGGNRPMR
jgi:hypothetical protein